MVVAIAEKQTEGVLAGILCDVIDERRTGRPFRVQPVELVADGVALFEHAFLPPPEHLGIALMFHAESAHRNAVHLLDAWRKLVAPRDVIRGTGGQYFDLAVLRKMPGDVPGVKFGAPVDRRAVPLNDDGDFHWASGSEPEPGPIGPPSSAR